MKRARLLQWAVASLVVALLLGGGCTEPPLGWPGAGRLQPLPSPAGDASGLVDVGIGPANLQGLCVPQGAICHANIECCNVNCDVAKAVCGAPFPGLTTPVCAPNGVVCEHSTDCCDGYCGLAAASGGSGSGSGSSGSTPLNTLGICGATPSPVCAPEGVLCHDTMQCCNAASEGGPGVTCNFLAAGQPRVCGTPVGPSALCVPYGVTCLDNKDCCVGVCTLNENMLLVCDLPPA